MQEFSHRVSKILMFFLDGFSIRMVRSIAFQRPAGIDKNANMFFLHFIVVG